jgi:hypothetical protein
MSLQPARTNAMDFAATNTKTSIGELLHLLAKGDRGSRKTGIAQKA